MAALLPHRNVEERLCLCESNCQGWLSRQLYVCRVLRRVGRVLVESDYVARWTRGGAGCDIQSLAASPADPVGSHATTSSGADTLLIDACTRAVACTVSGAVAGAAARIHTGTLTIAKLVAVTLAGTVAARGRNGRRRSHLSERKCWSGLRLADRWIRRFARRHCQPSPHYQERYRNRQCYGEFLSSCHRVLLDCLLASLRPNSGHAIRGM